MYFFRKDGPSRAFVPGKSGDHDRKMEKMANYLLILTRMRKRFIMKYNLVRLFGFPEMEGEKS